MGEDRQAPGKEDPGLGQVVMGDLRRTGLRRDIVREIRQLYHFYLDDAVRARLAEKNRLWRGFWLLGWLLKSLLMKLSPARRVMLVLALVLGIQGRSVFALGALRIDARLGLYGFLILLIVLMLELKDKLLAKDEIAVARQVQLALLPRSHPRIPGWSVWSCSRPANDVGGDLVDYIGLDGFRHAVLLGDVAGKGLGAALLTAKLQATLRALVPDAPSLADLGARANEIFQRDGLENRYATLFFAELEHHSGLFRYLNAGHNPAVVVRTDGTTEQLTPSSFPLGMLGSASYEEGTVQIGERDLVVVYSDGLTEALNQEGEEFGVPRLLELLPRLTPLPPEAVGGRILEEVDRFMGGARLLDDLSLMVIARR